MQETTGCLPKRYYYLSCPFRKAEAFAQEAKTVIWFADEQQALATCAIADRIKETSKKAIAELQQRGISVVMLTGDNEQTARRIAAELVSPNSARKYCLSKIGVYQTASGGRKACSHGWRRQSTTAPPLPS